MKSFARAIVALVFGCAVGVAAAQVAVPLEPAHAASTVLPSAVSSTTTEGSGSSPAGTHALNAQDLSSFFDGMVPFALERGDLAGGVLSVVKDGKVLFAKGYGYADLKTQTAPSPDDTLFRIGSTSKLFTWTAVMQLVQSGKLNLDRDVNDYLDFKIPPFQGKPITLRNLLTQSPGFEEVARNLISTDPNKKLNLAQYLKSHLPERIFPPGEIVAYSNYGCGLAGYIVQRVSGQDFDDYVEQHIYAPLHMVHSTFRQPLPPTFAPLMAKGYQSASDGKPKAFEMVDPAPAGAMSSTADDMAHFMIAQLQGGSYDGGQILTPATVALMHTPQRTQTPGENGYALGFYQENRNGQRILGHAGDLSHFHTDLHLLLDANVGVFMSFNSAGNAGGAGVVRAAVFNAFLDRYFPVAAQPPVRAATAQADAARVAGWYLSSRRNDSAMRMLYAITQSHVSALPNGDLVIAGINSPAGTPLHWTEVGPLHYQQAGGPHRLDFVTDASGKVSYWVTDAEPPVFIFQRVSGLKTWGSMKLWGTLSLLLMLATLLTWWFGAWTRRHYAQRLVLSVRQRRSRLASRLGALALFATLAGWMILLVMIGIDQTLLLEGTAVPWIYLLYVLGVLGVLGVLAIVINTVLCWLAPHRGRWVLLGETILALSAIYLGWLILTLGMVSFNVRF